MDAIPLLSQPVRLWRDKSDFFRPFRKAAKESAAVGENITPLFDPELAHGTVEQDADLLDLNNALKTLVDVFPDVEPEVFREMLTSISQESRVAVVTERVLKRDIKCTIRKRSRRILGWNEAGTLSKSKHNRGQLAVEDSFRGHRYHEAVKTLLYQEFKSLNRSAVKAVMAENNGSYTRSRPVLQVLASKTWRSSIVSFWSRKSTIDSAAQHPALFWQAGTTCPSIRSTGSNQLDQEIYGQFARPIVEKQRHQQIVSDFARASDLNEADAIEAGATYDCECCYSTVAFEQIATCEFGEHMLCFDCIRRTTIEALYGQGWARSVDLEKCSIRCFAPALHECQASLAGHFVKRALQQDQNERDTWSEFCKRITSDVLMKSRIVLQRCPFCDYAEVDETPSALLRRPAQMQAYFTRALRLAVGSAAAAICGSIVACIVAVLLACTMLLLVALSSIFAVGLLIRPSAILPASIGPFTLVGPFAATARASLSRVYQSRQGLKFECQDPSCQRTSCTKCVAEWQDPHICFEDEKTSLRTTIEASATAAVKRTCPKCLLSFVKASGCNKLVCNCGYTMCYVCRSEITSKEGYSHFCQHFRPSGGRCDECDRCDLYGDEDEETAIRQAAAIAEREWREKEAARNKSQAETGDALAARAMVEAIVGHGKQAPWQERWLDAVFDVLVVFKDD